jgi:hypothetical protein
VFTIIFPPSFFIFAIRTVDGFEHNGHFTSISHGDPDKNLVLFPFIIVGIASALSSRFPFVLTYTRRLTYSCGRFWLLHLSEGFTKLITPEGPGGEFPAGEQLQMELWIRPSRSPFGVWAKRSSPCLAVKSQLFRISPWIFLDPESLFFWAPTGASFCHQSSITDGLD